MLDAHKTSELQSRQRWDRALAIVEVVTAFALTHIAYRAIKQFTIVGAWDVAAHMNLTPGAVMIGITLVVLVVCRRSFEAYGLGCKQWRYWLALGLTGSLIILAIGAIGFLATRIDIDATRPPDPHARPSPLRMIALAAIAL